MKLLFLVVLILFLSSCIHPKIKFQKSHLLDPMMDPAKTQGFYQTFFAAASQSVERGASDVGGAVGSSCPTCGG